MSPILRSNLPEVIGFKFYVLAHQAKRPDPSECAGGNCQVEWNVEAFVVEECPLTLPRDILMITVVLAASQVRKQDQTLTYENWGRKIIGEVIEQMYRNYNICRQEEWLDVTCPLYVVSGDDLHYPTISKALQLHTIRQNLRLAQDFFFLTCLI